MTRPSDETDTTRSSSVYYLSSDRDDGSSMTELTNSFGPVASERGTSKEHKEPYTTYSESHGSAIAHEYRTTVEPAQINLIEKDRSDERPQDGGTPSNRSKIPSDHISHTVEASISPGELDRAICDLANSPMLQMHVRRQWWDEDLATLMQETCSNDTISSAVSFRSGGNSVIQNHRMTAPTKHRQWPPTITISDPTISGSPIEYTNSASPTQQIGHCTFQALPYGTSSASTLHIATIRNRPSTSFSTSSSSTHQDEQKPAQTNRVIHTTTHAILDRKSQRETPALLLTVETDVTDQFSAAILEQSESTALGFSARSNFEFLLSSLDDLKKADARFIIIRATGSRSCATMSVPWISRGMKRWLRQQVQAEDYYNEDDDDDVASEQIWLENVALAERRWREDLVTAVAQRRAERIDDLATIASEHDSGDYETLALRTKGSSFEVEISAPSIRRWRAPRMTVRCVGLCDDLEENIRGGQEAAWVCFVD